MKDSQLLHWLASGAWTAAGGACGWLSLHWGGTAPTSSAEWHALVGGAALAGFVSLERTLNGVKLGASLGGAPESPAAGDVK